MKLIHPVFIYCAVFAWLNLAWLTPQHGRRNGPITANSGSVTDSVTYQNNILYQVLDLQTLGLSRKAFDYAMKGYRFLAKKHLLSNAGFLTICDLSQSSKKKRMYLLNLEEKKVVINTYVAHGRNSGGEYATKFSNKPESLQSSLGFYTTSGTYYGEHGLSLRVQGVERGYNDQALRRNIVVHGASYLGDHWLSQSESMGRSYGCPAVPEEQSAAVISLIKNGSCLFIYQPNANYLAHSKILND